MCMESRTGDAVLGVSDRIVPVGKLRITYSLESVIPLTSTVTLT